MDNGELRVPNEPPDSVTSSCSEELSADAKLVEEENPDSETEEPSEFEVGMSPRPLMISDIMIMIAGIAFAIAFSYLWESELDAYLPTFKVAGSATGHRVRFAGHALGVMIPTSLALLAMQLTPPRNALKQLARRPGSVTLWAVTVVLTLQAVSLPLDRNTMGGITSPLIIVAFYWPTAIFSVLSACWSILVISGEWNPTDDWLDRLGVLIGMAWIGLFPTLTMIEFVLY